MAKKPAAPANDELKIEYVHVDDLAAYENNARTHSDEQILQVKRSMLELGWTNPIGIRAGTIGAGHGRIRAARLLWDEGGAIANCPRPYYVPVVRLDHLTDDQFRAWVLSDNKIAENAGWDINLLKIELTALGDAGFDLSLTGFDTAAIAGILAAGAAGGHGDPDEVPEPVAEPIVVLGDLFRVGKHRIVCGDSTDAHTVERVLAGEKPHLLVSDPPYGVNYDPDWRNHAMSASGRPIGGTATGKVMNDDRADWRDAWALFPGDVAYVWHGGLHAATVAESLAACDFNLRAQIIWNKQIMIIGRGDYHWKHEPCWYAVRKGKTGHNQGDRKQTTVWDIEAKVGVAKGGAGDEMHTGHGTQKPVECMARPIRNNSQAGDHVYEPFSGSGSTLIACEKEGRICHAIELNPQYVDVAIRRFIAFSGKSSEVFLVTEDGEQIPYETLLSMRDKKAAA